MKTTNIGNQALTQELVDMFVTLHPESNFIFQGRPMGLDGYTIDRLTNHKDAIATFDSWAKKIAMYHIESSPIKAEKIRPQVELLSLDTINSTAENFKSKYLSPIKRYISRYFIFNGVYKKRLNLIKNAKTLTYSGAGEVTDSNVFLRQLLEIRVAQLLGLKTAAVNQSVVLKTSLFHKLVGHVYGKLDKLVVRGEISKSNLISYGVNEYKISLAPDTAFKTRMPDNELAKKYKDKYKLTGKVVGINITEKLNPDLTKIEKVINLLKNHQYYVVFITNEPYGDKRIGECFAERFKIPFITDRLPYKDYAAFLSNLDFLISARLHSNVLALTAGTAIVPLEGNVFKTTELLDLAKYPVKVINYSDKNWEELLLTEVQNMLDGKYEFKEYFSNTIHDVQKQVVENATWLHKF